MDKEELLLRYCEIERRIIPIKDFLENKKNSTEYKGLYKGILTLQSPLVFNPEILFIGINAGDGAFKIKNPLQNETPLRMLGEDEMCFKELNWYEKGNSRGCLKNNKEWVPFQWYQRNQKTNNPFIKNMIDLLYEIGKLKYPTEYKFEKYDDNKFPFWYNNFGKKIMCTNLYPISTTDTKDLKHILDSLAHEKELQKLWKENIGKDKSINNWEVRKFFIKRVEELVRLVQPKIIVCMGTMALNDFIFSDDKKKAIYIKEKKIGPLSVPVIGFSRKGQWSSHIPEIAREIIKITNPEFNEILIPK